MKSRYPNRTYTSVASTSVNAESNPKGDAENRARETGDQVIDTLASKEACQLFPHTFVTTARATPGRRSDKPPLILSGYTGTKFNNSDNMWDLKKKRVGLGVTVSGNVDPSLNDVETHTVETSGLVTAVATGQYGVGDRLTWLPPDINSPNYDTDVSSLRRAGAYLTGGKTVLVNLVRVTPELELRTMDPAINRFVKIIADANTVDELRAAIASLGKSSNPMDALAYRLFVQPLDTLIKVMGLNTIDALLIHNCGVIGLRLGAKSLPKVQKLAPNRVLVESAYTDDRINNSWSAFVNVHAAISDAKEAVRPIGVAETSANPGQLFQLNLGKH